MKRCCTEALTIKKKTRTKFTRSLEHSWEIRLTGGGSLAHETCSRGESKTSRPLGLDVRTGGDSTVAMVMRRRLGFRGEIKTWCTRDPIGKGADSRSERGSSFRGLEGSHERSNECALPALGGEH